MSKCTIQIYGDEITGEVVIFEGSTVSEALAMKVEYLLNVGAGGNQSPTIPVAAAGPALTTPKPSGFLTKVKGGE